MGKNTPKQCKDTNPKKCKRKYDKKKAWNKHKY